MITVLIRTNRRFAPVAATLAFACLMVACVSVRAQTTQSPIPLPNPPTPVVDYANVIDDATEHRLNSMLMNLSENSQANVEMAAVTVRTTGGQDIFDYSLAVMRGWGIGSAEKGGLLLVIAVDDRKYFTQVSRHLEGELPDGVVGEIQRRYLVGPLREGNYSKGIMDTMQAYIATLAEKRGFSVEGIDQRYAYRPPQTTQQRRTRRSSLSGCGTLFIIIFILIILLSSRGGRGGGGGCLNALLLGSLLNSASRGSSNWSGGGFGGGGSDWGGGGGGWGGFSGGGGDAGGGGAGGSW